MFVTRLGYLLIVGIVAGAAVAIFVVLQRSADDPPSISVEQVIGFSRYGVIDSISASGRTLKVHFRNDFDTKSQLGNSSHDYEATLREGDNLLTMLETSGVKINSADGVRVTVH